VHHDLLLVSTLVLLQAYGCVDICLCTYIAAAVVLVLVTRDRAASHSCRLQTRPHTDGKRILQYVLYASPVGAYMFVKLGTTVLKLDGEHLKSYYKGQVHMTT
jgi:hypothetical protein